MCKSARYSLYILIVIASPSAFAQNETGGEVLSADTPTNTVSSNPFTAPADWRLSVRGPATFVEAPEGGSRIVLVDVEADDSESALAAAWAATFRGHL